MASFYNDACRVDAKMALFQPELQVSVIDEGLTYYVPKEGDEKFFGAEIVPEKAAGGDGAAGL